MIISLPWKTGENENLPFWAITQSYFHKKKSAKDDGFVEMNSRSYEI